ncbi:GH92 family glycosyl hydrolase [Lactococcus allomyrinae]|uniref:Alpha-mannosidase n=1 Tax=Lactococcus allomyrinae TaxID=2419773 RepID=A0A387B8A6_9LACT|nr:GH92 family glycosyl hydrolase [Lactococcus allomyrinae]AYG00045.1 alpha-mannosidase [Lactococcus allomyrinae]
MNLSTIDTRHATANSGSFSHGNCLPYTGLPWGMNYFAPSTADNKGAWWFHPEDQTFEGYRLTHQPSPWMGDFSHFTMTPVAGYLPETSLWHTISSYRPREAVMTPAQIKLTQLRYQITSRLIPSMYGGVLEMEFNNSAVQDNALMLHLPGKYELSVLTENEIAFSVVNFAGCEDKDFKFYVVMAFDNPVSTDKNSVSADRKCSGTDGAVRIDFGAVSKQIVRFGTSFISYDQAKLNLSREQEWSVENYLENAEKAWNEQLSKIEIEHHDASQVSTFYHNLYRAFLFPQTFYEFDQKGKKIHYDTFDKSVKSGPLYTNNGFWDTFRTVYPLYSLIAVEQYGDMLEGFLNSYRETGFLPKWLSPDERGLMPGTLIDAVIADAAAKGIRPDLMPEFLSAMKKSATVQSDNPNYGRQGTADYLKYGYVPLAHHESVNHTLDYSFSDYCISRVAKVVGDNETADFYAKQALNYRNIFDKTTGFMRAKDENGEFRPDFLDVRWGRDYAEGSAWQTSWSVFQDFAGLINLHGGADNFEQKLIELCNQRPNFNVEGYGFEIHEMSEMAALEFGQVAISNQPSFHYPYLFSYIGKPWMAQPLIKNLLTQAFDDTPNGYPGDEDNGTMAAWYIFSSLGFYPVTAASLEYVIGLPLWDKAVMHLSSGKDLTILSEPNQPQQMFVQSVSTDKKTVSTTFFRHDDLMAGGEIKFELGIVPNPQQYKDSELPYSLSK